MLRTRANQISYLCKERLIFRKGEERKTPQIHKKGRGRGGGNSINYLITTDLNIISA